MSKTLLIGPAGSGKTHRLLAAFEQTLKNSQNPLAADFFFILPSAEHTDRIINMILRRAVPGFFHRRVTTLSRFIGEILGAGSDGLASSVTRFLILRDIFDKNSWDIFREVQQSAGFIHLMLSFISELKESLITPAVFRDRMNELKRLEPDLSAKYEALAAIYESYENALRQKGLRDEPDTLSLYLERKKSGASPSMRFKKIWLDGFFDFSALQLAILRELSSMTDEMVITLTEGTSSGREDLFEALRPTKEALLAMGFSAEGGPAFGGKSEIASGKKRPRNDKEKQSTKASQTPQSLRANEVSEAIPYSHSNSVLAHLERNIFSSPKPKTKPAPGSSVMIFEAVGMEGEMEMIARTIETMHQSGDYRFSDFAILFRQIGEYEGVIRSVFGRYQIPVEVHEREKLGFSPVLQVMVRLVRVFREDWKRSDLIGFLKSSYVCFLGGEKKDDFWVYGLEHRAMAQGVFRGREVWLSSWQSEKPEDKIFQGQRMEKLGVLAHLEDELRTAKDFPGLKKIMMHAVQKTFGIFQIVDSLEEHIRRDAASFKRFESILDEIGMSLAPSEISFDQFADRFFRLAGIDLYSLHEKDKDKVQVYDVSLARQKEYKVVFVAGLLEKKFPVQIKEDPVLSDWERCLFNSVRQDEILKQRLPRQNMEKYLFYLALTRAREKLVLTYPRLDLEGREALPSYYVSEVKARFDESLTVKKQNLARPCPELDQVITERELEMSVMGELWAIQADGRQRGPLIVCLTHELLKRKESRERFRRAFYEIRDELTDSRIAQAGVFHAFETSPTALEEYARCPFKYYAHRVLKLRDPEEDESAKTRGTILHKVLENFFKAWTTTPEIFKDRTGVQEKIDEGLDDALRKNPFRHEKKYQFDLEREGLREMIERFMDKELARLEQSALRPQYFEFAFGLPDAKAPPLELELAGGRTVSIRGKIDRIDVDRDGRIGAVTDYKTNRGFSKADLELGVGLQLPLYLMVLERDLKLKAAGAEIYSIRGREKNGFYHKDYAAFYPGLSQRKMILSDFEFRRVLSRAADFIREFSAQMEAVKIPARPRKVEECDYCSYASVCRIEKWRRPMIVEEIKAEILAKGKNEKGRTDERPAVCGPAER